MPANSNDAKLGPITFFLVDFSGGGIERVNINLANALSQKGYPVDIVVAIRKGEFADRIDPKVRIIELGCPRAYQCLMPLVRYLRATSPRVLLTCFPTLNIVAIAAKLIARAKTTVVPVEHMPVSVDRRENPSRLPRIAYSLYPLFYRAVPAVVLNCEESARDFAIEFPGLAHKARVIYNPVVSEDTERLAQEPAALWPVVKTTTPVLVGAGRLTRQKNFPLLLRAFAQILKTRQCKLVIIGNRGEDKAALLKLTQDLQINEDVVWTGFVANPYAYFSRANLFVLSSLYETLPTVLIEALACGTNAVATPCFGVAEILQQGRLGTVTENFELNSLIAAIEHSLDHPIAPDSLKQRANEFAIKTCADSYAALIEQVNA